MIKRIVFRPIGWVFNQVAGARYADWEDVVSEIVLDEELAPALDGIEGFSHIEVFFYIAGVTRRQRQILKLHPRDQQDRPLTGVFATRTQYRPNPIGHTIAQLIERRGNTLRVSGLDAYNGTPVLDIKPHVPEQTPGDQARTPEWLQRLQQSPEANNQKESS